MLNYAATFALMGLVASIFGWGITNDASGIAKILFFVFAIMAACSLGIHALGRHEDDY